MLRSYWLPKPWVVIPPRVNFCTRHMSNFCQILPQLVTRHKNVKLNPSKDIKLLKCPSNDMTQSEMTCHRFNFTGSLHSSTNHLKFPTCIHSC